MRCRAGFRQQSPSNKEKHATNVEESALPVARCRAECRRGCRPGGALAATPVRRACVSAFRAGAKPLMRFRCWSHRSLSSARATGALPLPPSLARTRWTLPRASTPSWRCGSSRSTSSCATASGSGRRAAPSRPRARLGSTRALERQPRRYDERPVRHVVRPPVAATLGREEPVRAVVHDHGGVGSLAMRRWDEGEAIVDVHRVAECGGQRVHRAIEFVRKQ
jgi:hypothetical protein